MRNSNNHLSQTVRREDCCRIGVAGGGQLARMLAQAAQKLDLSIAVLDPDEACAAVRYADKLIVDGFDTLSGLDRLAEACESITFEIESVNAEALGELEKRNIHVSPSAKVLAMIQDKLTQKEFLTALGIPTSDFVAFSSEQEPNYPLPAVWKARRGGYDGRGVAVIRTAYEMANVPAVPALLEQLVDIEHEFAIIVARNRAGDMQCFPLTEILMDKDAHILDTVVAPAHADRNIEEICKRHACTIAQALEYVGVLAIEFFLDRSGEIFVNELSPRPHNSGHYSIEACETSQFEQHLRAITGLPLGATTLKKAAATFNLLGPVAPEEVFNMAMRNEFGADVFVHDYEKGELRPGRKVGHITVTADTADEAMDRVGNIKRKLASRWDSAA